MQIPKYTDVVAPNEAPNVSLPANAPSSTFGGDVATAVGTAAAVVNKYAEKFKKVEDTNAVLAASNAMSGDMLNAFNGTNGFFSLHGANALGVTDKAQQWMQDTIKQYSDGLANKEQQQMFAQRMKENSFNMLRDTATHEANEYHNYQLQNIKDSFALTSTGMAAHYNSIDSLRNDIATNDQTNDQLTNVQGYSPEQTQFNKLQQNSLGLTNAFNAAMNSNNLNAAQNILTNFKDNMDAVTYSKLSKVLTGQQDKLQNFNAINSIVQQATRSDGTVDYKLAHDLLDKNYGENASQANLDTSKWVTQTNVDTQDLQDSTKNGVNKILPFLQQYGNTQISSGYRSPEHNAGVPGASPTSYHTAGKAVDIVFPTDLTNDQANQVVSEAKKEGWEEAEYKDEGTGLHLHLGNYTGGTAFDIDRYNKMSTMLDAKLADITRQNNEAKQESFNVLAKQINNAGSAQEAADMVQNAQGLTVEQANSLNRAIVSKFKALGSTDPVISRQANKWAEIERNLNSYLQIAQGLEDKMSTPDGLTPKEQMRYNNLVNTLSNYAKFSNQGGYDNLMNNYKQEKQNEADIEQQIFSGVSDVLNATHSKSQAIDYINKVTAAAGINNAQYFIDNIDWKAWKNLKE